MLSDKEKKKIFHKSLYVLEKIGVEIRKDEALELLKDAGAKVEGQRVHFKPHHVRKALSSAPSYIPIYDRNGELAMELGSEENYFGPGSDNPSTLDLETGERRQSNLEDVKNFSLLVDALPDMDFLMSMALPQDVPTKLADLYQFRTMVVNSSKPFVFTSADNRNTEALFEMAAAIAGGTEELEERPFFIQYTEPTSPLVGTEDALGRLLLSAEYGIPATYTSGTLPGASSPATPAGTVVMSLAEELSGVVISQLRRPGAPVIIGGAASPMDMKTAGASYGLPAALIIDKALSEVSKYLDMPVFSEAGFSDSKLIDGQQSMEASISISEMARSDADLIHDVGYLESGQTGSLESVVIGNEIVGYVRRLQRGINLDKKHLAIDALKRVGPGGGFLTDQSTLDNFKTLYQPELLDRRSYDSWKEKGGKDLRERAREKAGKILDEHEPEPLSGEKVRVMDQIIEDKESQLA
ncbi:trimethylamine methyltransferase family protein [Candidatus Bipolaricaulota bacterium]|nr:trimethylamine methyltransferase family protein [Candidatus Bipolaricaulota bacterium]